MMIKYQNKPTEDNVKLYIQKLEYYLSGLFAKVNINLHDLPMQMEEINQDGNIIEKINLWINNYEVITQCGSIIIKNIREGIDGSETNYEIWSDAFSIQQKLYKDQINIIPDPRDKDDPYGLLWDKYPD